MSHLFSHTAPRMLYIHWPFCAAKCHYCDFVAMQDHNDFSTAYHNALCSEIRAFVAGRPHLLNTPIQTIFLGGGTPSLYPLPLLAKLFQLLRELFDLSGLEECSLEVNPGGQTDEHFAVWRDVGINRLSVGVQVLDDAVLARLNRPQHTNEVHAFFERAPHFISNLSADCIIGLPGVDAAVWQKTVAAVTTWPLKHASLYFLTVHENTPLYYGIKKGSVVLPSDEVLLEQYATTVAAYEKAGISQYEISNFARPGFESMHNRGYWDRVPYAGFGLGAASFDGSMRCVNKKNLVSYIKRFSSGELAGVHSWYSQSEVLTHENNILEALMLGLRQQKGVDLHRVVYLCRLFETDAFNRIRKKLVVDGYLEDCSTHMRLTPRGQIFENEVVVRLSSGLEGDHAACDTKKMN